MKLKKLFNSLPKRIAAAATLAIAVMFPVATMASATVHMEGALGVANVTAGETTYKATTNATYDQVVKYQVYYHNTELPDSGKIAQNVRVKIALPTQPGTNQVATATISADNTNTVTSSATVKLNRADAYLQFIPGSAVWRHNTGTNEKPVWTETKVSDDVVNGGLRLENEKPCFNYAATVTVLARVSVPGVKITKQVRVKGSTTWQTATTAKPGQTVQYLITYQNTGNTNQNKVVVRDNLPPKLALVPGTTYLKNTTNPNGVLYNSDLVTAGGIVIGDYKPGGGAYVWFDVKLPTEANLACGNTSFRNVGIVKPEGMNEYYNTADVTVNKVCQPPKPETPVYSCDLLQVTKGANRTVTAKVNYTAKNGASLKMVTYNWGDTKTTTTDQTTASHQYAADGTYKIAVRLLFNVNGKDTYAADNANCVQSVTFTPPTTPPVTPPTTPETPEVLPNTGAGSVIGLFAAATIAGALLYRVVLSRKVTE